MDRGLYLKSGPYSILHTFRVLWTTFPNVDRFFTVKNRWSIFGKDESGLHFAKMFGIWTNFLNKDRSTF